MSNWQLDNGSKAQIFINYLPYEQEIFLDVKSQKGVRLHNLPQDYKGVKVSAGKIVLKIPALNAVMLSYA